MPRKGEVNQTGHPNLDPKLLQLWAEYVQLTQPKHGKACSLPSVFGFVKFVLEKTIA